MARYVLVPSSADIRPGEIPMKQQPPTAPRKEDHDRQPDSDLGDIGRHLRASRMIEAREEQDTPTTPRVPGKRR